jgi:putative hydrolase of the HAD superfamily
MQKGQTIRAVILDYGEVLCLRPKTEALQRMATLFGMEPERFFGEYIPSRGPYDHGLVTETEYWTSFGEKYGVRADAAMVAQLRSWDTEMWSEVSPEMTQWLERLAEAGMVTALLSNMQHDMAAYARKNFAWLKLMRHEILSCEVGLIKPDPAIFQLSIERVGVKPEEILFVDDREANVASAREAGIVAVRFQGVAELAEELKEIGFGVLPRVEALRT